MNVIENKSVEERNSFTCAANPTTATQPVARRCTGLILKFVLQKQDMNRRSEFIWLR
jgi:hypothetical protein